MNVNGTPQHATSKPDGVDPARFDDSKFGLTGQPPRRPCGPLEESRNMTLPIAMVKQFACGLVVGSAAFAYASAADAAVVTITAGAGAGTVVFDSGGYEGSTAGSPPGVSDPAVGSYSFGTATVDPTVQTGSYMSGEDPNKIQGPSAALYGDNYLAVDRSISGGGSQTRLFLNFNTDITLATSSFEIEWAQWQGDASYTAIGIGSTSASSATDYVDLIGTFGLRENGTTSTNAFIHTYGLGSGHPNPADFGTWDVGEWNLMKYAWDHTSGTGSLTVGANTYNLDQPSSSTTTTVGRMILQSNSPDGQPYFDSVAIPEPASLGLAGIGAMVLLARQRVNAEASDA